MTAKFWEKFKHKTFCDDRIVMIKNCLYCKKEFIPLRKKKGETTKFCCYQCSSLYAKENMLKKNCIECNKLFKAPNNRCKFCGILCWNKNNLQKRREYVSNYIKNNPIKYKKSYDKRNKKIGKNIERYDKNCLICNKVFEDKTLNFNKKFCSKKCRGVSCDKRYKEKGGVGLKLHINISSRIRGTFKKNKPLNKYLEIFGYNIDDIKKHLQNKFTEGMTWENYGLWHIDHIKPVSLFNLNDEKQLIECWRLENLQPLWAADNQRKSNKYDK